MGEAMGAESSRLPAASRKMGPQSCNCRAVDSANHSVSLEGDPEFLDESSARPIP